MFSQESSNVEMLQHNIDVPQNLPMHFVTLKNYTGSPTLDENNSMSKITNAMNLISSKQIKNPNVMKKPRDNDQEILTFYLYHFKCLPCPLKKGTCQDKSTCEGWHHEGERRRNPGTGSSFLYSEEPCPRLKTPGTSKWSKPTNCKDGDSCPFAHTLMEQMYHPNIYKTSLCTNFTANGGDQCQWGYYCTHAHGQKDIRNLNRKDILKRQTIHNMQTIRNNISQITNGRASETFCAGVPVTPKLIQKMSPIDTTNDDSSNLHYFDQQTSVSHHSSDNGSPSRPYHTPLYQSTMSSSNAVNTANTKYSITPNSSLMTQSIKSSQFMLPTSCYQSQIPARSTTPNTITYETKHYNMFQTVHKRLGSEKLRHYSWDINVTDIPNLELSSSAGTTFNNVNNSPLSLPVTPFDMANIDNNSINIANGNNTIVNLSPKHSGQIYVSSTSSTNSALQRPVQLPRPHSLNLLSNTKLPVTVTSNSIAKNQSVHLQTPPYTMKQVSRFPASTSTYQSKTPQLSNIAMQTTNSTSCSASDINSIKWPTVSQNSLNTCESKSLHFINNASSQQKTSQQMSEIGQINLDNMRNQSIENEHLTKETRNNMSYYFLGDDSLLSPTSHKFEESTNVNLSTKQSITDKKNEESIVIQLKAEINELKKELESEKEKHTMFQSEKDTKRNDSNCDDRGIGKTHERINLSNKYIACPNYHPHKGVTCSNVLTPLSAKRGF